jgi:hypothetical protein
MEASVAFLGYVVRRARAVALLFATGVLPACAAPRAPIAGIEEASGVTMVDGDLYVVGDHEPGTYYRVRLAGLQPPRLRLEPDRLSRHLIAGGAYAADLESIHLLPDGRIAILSERLFSLLGETDVVAQYAPSLAEFGGRGLEGLAVRPLDDRRARVAVLWEGGYPDPERLPAPVAHLVCESALRPVILVHDLDPGATGVAVEGTAILALLELRVPMPEGVEPFAQRFRAPDLVWHRLHAGEAPDAWGFIVLLSSEYGSEPPPGAPEECPRSADDEPLRYCYKWLQRFDAEGEPFGDPFDLAGAFPPEIRDLNWEGMGWYEPGRSLVFVYDEKVAKRAIDPQEAFVLPLPEGW